MKKVSKLFWVASIFLFIPISIFAADTYNIYESGENLGFGDENPEERLSVDGKIYTADGIIFPDGSTQTSSAESLGFYTYENGDACIGNCGSAEDYIAEETLSNVSDAEDGGSTVTIVNSINSDVDSISNLFTGLVSGDSIKDIFIGDVDDTDTKTETVDGANVDWTDVLEEQAQEQNIGNQALTASVLGTSSGEKNIFRYIFYIGGLIVVLLLIIRFKKMI